MDPEDRVCFTPKHQIKIMEEDHERVTSAELAKDILRKHFEPLIDIMINETPHVAESMEPSAPLYGSESTFSSSWNEQYTTNPNVIPEEEQEVELSRRSQRMPPWKAEASQSRIGHSNYSGQVHNELERVDIRFRDDVQTDFNWNSNANQDTSSGIIRTMEPGFEAPIHVQLLPTHETEGSSQGEPGGDLVQSMDVEKQTEQMVHPQNTQKTGKSTPAAKTGKPAGKRPARKKENE